MLDDAVAADAALEVTRCAAAIEVAPIAVIALFTIIEESVSALRPRRNQRRLDAAEEIAAVARIGIAVIALFTADQGAVTTDRPERRFAAAVGAATISINEITIITLFGDCRFQCAITAAGNAEASHTFFIGLALRIEETLRAVTAQTLHAFWA